MGSKKRARVRKNRTFSEIVSQRREEPSPAHQVVTINSCSRGSNPTRDHSLQQEREMTYGSIP
ncbi:hypothetical protein [Phaffia rhodozyma]|uniref:Uncharacterized protein n=1 Tax=Phaffia rhodozyma TaxID=264483 RepID=A0A0F7SMR2_PHARH|nr:hypothetical protein [Phaffia rhodozyma]